MEKKTLAAIMDLFEDIQLTPFNRMEPSFDSYLLLEEAEESFGHDARAMLDGVVRVYDYEHCWTNYSDSALVGVAPVPLAEKAELVDRFMDRQEMIAVTTTVGGANMRIDYKRDDVKEQTDAEIQDDAISWLAWNTHNCVKCGVPDLEYCSDLDAFANLLKEKGLLK
jgi:hypothetical protein